MQSQQIVEVQPQVRGGARSGAAPAAPGGRLREVGLRLVLSKVLRRLWSTHRSIAVVRELGSSYRPSVDMHVEFVDPDLFSELPDLVAAAIGVEYLYIRPIERARRARAGTMSVARTAAGDVIAFHFVHATENHPALETVAPKMYPKPEPDEVLTEAVYCLPAYRGRAFAPRLLEATGARLAAGGKRRAWAYLDTTNLAALRMFNRAGYAPSGVERVDRYRLGRFSTVFRNLTPKTENEWSAAVAGSREAAGLHVAMNRIP